MLPQEIVKQVRRIRFQMDRHVSDVLAGHYLSVFKGQGIEFEEVRPYVPGDDVRTIDWNVTARVGVPYIKRYTEERELTVMLVVDISRSQDFGSAERSKRQAAVELSALLSFAAIHNGDKVGLLLFHSEVELYIPPRKGDRHALRVVREVLARGMSDGSGPGTDRLRAQRTGVLHWMARRLLRRRRMQQEAAARCTDLSAALELCRRVLKRRSVIFLISDFLDHRDEGQGYLKALRGVRSRHDVIAVLVTDERERTLEPCGLIELEDAETSQVQLIDTGHAAFRRALAEAAEARLGRLRGELQGLGIDLLHIDATRPVVDPLMAFFRMRQRRRRR
ncbi:MAG: DUF58 domain-containing protein [Myxococcales bacterium]|nr:DUF58 domain-containing protein [Myxococcota bacterium]MDW8283455.1 DUF58 domain-containing protein [Myxococcales bacterium]